MPDIATLTKTKTRLKIAVATAGITMAMAAGAAGGANYMIGRGLVLNNDFFRVPESITAGANDAKLLSVNMSFSDGPFFLAAEPVNLSQIKVAFIGNGVSGDALQKMVKNLSLYYHRISGAGYGYGYGSDDTVLRFLGLAPQTEKVGSENIVTAIFALPQSPAIRIQPGNVYNFELHGYIPADAPSGQFVVLIDDVVGWGFQTGKYVRLVKNNSQGQIMSVAPKTPLYNVDFGALPALLMRGQKVTLSMSIANAIPNARVLFFLQRPDGTMKFNGIDQYNIGTEMFSATTNAQGAFGVTKEIALPIEGQTGNWISWVTVGGIASNRVQHMIIPSLSPPPVLPSVTVLAPNGGEQYKIGDTVRIKWQAKGVDRVSIYITDDRIKSSGSTNYVSFPGQGSLSVPAAQGYYDWKINSSIPSGQGNNYRISISARADSNISDQSDAPFSITAAPTPTISVNPNPTPTISTRPGATTTPSITVLTPNGGEKIVKGQDYEIKWQGIGFKSGDRIALTLVKKEPSGPNNFIAWVDASKGSYIWKAGVDVLQKDLLYQDTDKLRIRIFWEREGIEASSGDFSLVAPSITVLSPQGGEQWEQGKTYQIKWQSSGVARTKIVVSSENGAYSQDSAAFGALGRYDFKVPSNFPIGKAKVHVQDLGNDKIFGAPPNGYLTIVAPPSITVLSPNGGEKLEVGKQYTIQWKANGVGSVNINLVNYSPALASQYNLAANVPAGQGSYTWTAQNARPDSNYKIVVVGGLVSDVSDAAFSIVAPATASGQNKYTLTRNEQIGYRYPRCACDTNAAGDECGADFATSDPTGSVCYDWSRRFYNRYVSKEYRVLGPRLKVSVGQVDLPEAAMKGATGVTLAKYIFEAGDSGEDIKISIVELQQTVEKISDKSDAVNLRLFDGATAVSGGYSTLTDSTKYLFTLSPLTIAKGTLKVIILKGDIVGNAAGKYQQWGLATDAKVEAVGVSSGQKALVQIIGSSGKKVNIISGGQYSVTLDSSTPTGKLIAANTSKNTMTVLKFYATNEPIAVNKIRLGLTNPNSSANDLSQVYIYDGATLLGQGILGIGNAQGGTANAQTTFNLSSPLVIPANSSKIVTIKADIAPITTVSSIATAGDAIVIDFIGSTDPAQNSGVGQSSARQITTDSPTTQQPPTYIFRSVPTVSAVPLPTTTLNNGTMALYKFKVSADAKGDVDLFKFTFKIESTNPITGGSLTIKRLMLVDVADPDEHFAYTDFASAINGDNYIIIAPAWTVAATASRIFELRGTISGASVGSYVSTKLLGDASSVAAVSNSTASASAENDFIWSDWSDARHTIISAGNDWHNGYLVNGLPASGLGPQTLSR